MVLIVVYEMRDRMDMGVHLEKGNGIDRGNRIRGLVLEAGNHII